MSNLNIANEISLVDANNFKTTKESRSYLLSLLSNNEQKIFKDFIKSVSK